MKNRENRATARAAKMQRRILYTMLAFEVCALGTLLEHTWQRFAAPQENNKSTFLVELLNLNLTFVDKSDKMSLATLKI